MTTVFDRDLNGVPFSAFTWQEQATLCTAYFLHLAVQVEGLKVVPPEDEPQYRVQGYGLLELKEVTQGEQEVFSVAQEIQREQDDGSGECETAGWLFEGVLLATADGRLIFRSWWRGGVLEPTYRTLRYGALLGEGEPLPAEHLLSFEEVTWGDVPGLLRVNVTKADSGEVEQCITAPGGNTMNDVLRMDRAAVELETMLGLDPVHQHPGPLAVSNEQIGQATLTFMNPGQSPEHAIFAHRGAYLLAAILRSALLQGTAFEAALDEDLSRPQGLEGAVKALQGLHDPMINEWLTAFLGQAPETVNWEVVGRDVFLKNSWESLVTTVQQRRYSHDQ